MVLGKILMIAGELEGDGKVGNTQPFIDRQIESLKDLGLDVITYSIKGWESKLNYVKSIFKINEILKNNPDISLIHAHYSYSGIVSSFQRRVPIIVSLMGSDTYGSVNENGKMVLSGRIESFLTKAFLSKWQVVIVKSQGMLSFINHKKAYVVPNGVDLNFFKQYDKFESQRKLNWNKDYKYIIFGGNPDNPRKNFSLAKKTFEIVNKEFTNVELIPLKNIQHNLVPIYFSAADCMLFTSYREGSPNVVKEAIACNLPVVSVKVGDVEERLSGLPNCFVTDYNANKLANKVTFVLKKNEKTNLRDSLKELEASEVAKRILRIYEEMVG